MSRDKHSRSIRIGNIENSTGIAVGDGAYAAVNQPKPSMQDEVSALLDEFMQSLERYRDALDDAESVRHSVVEARIEVTRPSPKWQIVRQTLTGIAAAVAGVASLTDAINNIQALVSHVID
jgi:Family of unknown function (DUF5955)